MVNNQTVGKRIAAMRQVRNLTQQQLAAMMNISHQAVSKWESGQALPDIQILLELTRFFGVTVEQLMVEKDENTTGNVELDEYEADTTNDTNEEIESNQQEEAERMSIQQLLQLAPYMSRETVEKIVMDADEPLKTNQIIRVAPYLKSESIESLIEKYQLTFTLEQLRKIAPFMRREAVDMLARSIVCGKESERQGNENINKAINDIGKAFDDIGRGMGHAVKKAIRFGENVLNEVSTAINDISSDTQPKQNQQQRSERVLALRRKAFERAIADQNWDWLATHIQETADDSELRNKIAAAACENGKQDWLAMYMAEYANEKAIDSALQSDNWKWLGENVLHFEAEQQIKIANKACENQKWKWLEENISGMYLQNGALKIAMQALHAKETRLAIQIAEEQLTLDEVSKLADNAYELKCYDALDVLLPLSNDAEIEKIMLNLAEKQEWNSIERYIQLSATETLEKLLEIAVEQGNFDAIDALDAYL